MADRPTPPKPKPTRRARGERGDAGLPLLLITPALLIIVLHLINASQQLYERREAFSVASAAARFGNQADPLAVRDSSEASIDEGAAEDSIRRFAAAEGYSVVELNFVEDRGDGTVTITVEVQKPVDYLFPIPTALSDTVTGRAESVLNRGISAAGAP